MREKEPGISEACPLPRAGERDRLRGTVPQTQKRHVLRTFQNGTQPGVGIQPVTFLRCATGVIHWP